MNPAMQAIQFFITACIVAIGIGMVALGFIGTGYLFIAALETLGWTTASVSTVNSLGAGVVGACVALIVFLRMISS